MRVVLDTNIFISGIHWNGPSRKVLNAWLDKEIRIVVSADIVDEIMRTLKSFKIPLMDEDLELWESLILGKSNLVYPAKKVTIVKDPDDNKFVEAAIEGRAEYIVSQDKHLLIIKEYAGIRMVKPETFLKILD